MCTEVIVVRSKTENDAVVRLQSDAVLRGLAQIGGPPSRVLPAPLPEPMIAIQDGACVLFHYDDVAAAKAVRYLQSTHSTLTAGCFASDIYTFDPYLEVHDFVDFYMAPTRLHRLVLISQLYKPVYLLPESIDPSATHRSVAPSIYPNKTTRQLLWFGYPESFEKSMVSILPVLKRRLRARSIDSFTLISSTEKLKHHLDLDIRPYSRASFSQDAASFDYCILSHLPLDLALNSFIKSPNKLIAALFLGLVPIASRTPSYEDILMEFGLGRFLFDSAADLDRKLRNLEPERDCEAIRESGILATLASRYSDASIATLFMQVLSEVNARDQNADLELVPTKLESKRPTLRTREHLLDLIPSLQRSMQWRINRR